MHWTTGFAFSFTIFLWRRFEESLSKMKGKEDIRNHCVRQYGALYATVRICQITKRPQLTPVSYKEFLTCWFSSGTGSCGHDGRFGCNSRIGICGWTQIQTPLFRYCGMLILSSIYDKSGWVWLNGNLNLKHFCGFSCLSARFNPTWPKSWKGFMRFFRWVPTGDIQIRGKVSSKMVPLGSHPSLSPWILSLSSKSLEPLVNTLEIQLRISICPRQLRYWSCPEVIHSTIHSFLELYLFSWFILQQVANQLWNTLYDYPCLKGCEGLLKYIRACVTLAWGLTNLVSFWSHLIPRCYSWNLNKKCVI